MPATYTDLNAHIIFATKSRSPMIDASWSPDLFAYLGGTIRGLGAVPLAVNGVADHVHLLVGFRAHQNLSDLIRETKKSATGWAREHWHAFQWQEGFAAFSVSHRDIDSVRSYIARQEQHHQKVSSRDELLALLAECGLEADPRYFE